MAITSSRAISLPAIIAGLGGGNAVGTNAVAVGATLTNSLSTGNATNPNFVIQVGVKVASGASQATATTAFTIAGETLLASFAGAVSINGGTISTNGLAVAGTSLFTGAVTINSSGGLAITGNGGVQGGRYGLGLATSSTIVATAAGQIGFTSSTDPSASPDTFFIRSAAANMQLGGVAVDTAPVAQTLSVQNTLAGGTSNVAGAAFTIAGSQGKGTGVGGSLIFQTAAAGTTGTVVNPLVTALTLTGAGAVITALAVADSGYNYQVPSTGFTITMANGNYHLIVDPAGTLATGTITMCAAPVDGQVVDIKISQIITALTVAGNSGQSVKGNPTSAAVGSSFTGIYRATNTTWYF